MAHTTLWRLEKRRLRQQVGELIVNALRDNFTEAAVHELSKLVGEAGVTIIVDRESGKRTALGYGKKVITIKA